MRGDSHQNGVQLSPSPHTPHRNQQEDKLKAKLKQQQQSFNKNPSLKTPINTTRIPRTSSTYTYTKHEQHEKTNAKWQGLPSPNVMVKENLRRAIHKILPSSFKLLSKTWRMGDKN